MRTRAHSFSILFSKRSLQSKFYIEISTFFFHYLFATTTKSCICGHSTRVYTQASRLPAAPSYPWSHCTALGLSAAAAAVGGARTGTMHARSCSARTPHEATAASSRCALPTVYRSLDCQQRQVWAAGSSFIHFRGDLTRQVSCYTLPYRGWDWVPVCWGRSREGQF